MAARNAERFLQQAVDSVLTQTVSDLELLVVDDASTDSTPSLLASVRDARLRVLRLERPGGPFVAANRGLAEARGDFIARLDADDVCLPNRLARQLAFLDGHPSVGLVGSGCSTVDEAGRPLGHWRMPASDGAIRWRCLFAPPFLHSSVVWRAALGFRYDASLEVAGDYELWTRALALTRAANLEEPLVTYRVWAGGITGTRAGLQQDLHDEISLGQVRARWPALAVAPGLHRELRRALARGAAPPSAAAEELAHRLRAAFLAESGGDATELAEACPLPRTAGAA